MSFRVVLVVLFSIFSVPAISVYAASSPSFNCNLAKSTAEKLICSHDELAKLDVKLSKIYKLAKSRAAKIQFDIEEIETATAWFKNNATTEWKWREKNCKNVQCLRSWYVKRQALMEWIANFENPMGDYGITLVEQIANDSVIITYQTATYSGNVFYNAKQQAFEDMPNGWIRILSKRPLFYKMNSQKSYFNQGGAFWFTTIRNQTHQIIAVGQEGTECLNRSDFISKTNLTQEMLEQTDFEVICITK